jgi:aminopeptidase N
MVKVVILLAAISIASGVPLKFKSSRETYQKLMMKQLLTNGSVVPSDFQLSTAEDSMNFRLPNKTIPLHYNIRISTNIHAGRPEFEGVTRITIKVLENSTTITLHAIQMTVKGIHLFTKDMRVIETDLSFEFDEVKQFLIITLKDPLQVDEEVIVYVDHSGQMTTNRIGFYQTSYRNPVTFETFWVASTLFEPVHARSASLLR